MRIIEGLFGFVFRASKLLITTAIFTMFFVLVSYYLNFFGDTGFRVVVNYFGFKVVFALGLIFFSVYEGWLAARKEFCHIVFTLDKDFNKESELFKLFETMEYLDVIIDIKKDCKVLSIYSNQLLPVDKVVAIGIVIGSVINVTELKCSVEL